MALARVWPGSGTGLAQLIGQETGPRLLLESEGSRRWADGGNTQGARMLADDWASSSTARHVVIVSR
ncbi:hypothetical protein SAMD00023353_3800970 [Rosellinia necatrix]|uniref:Uncharacterized protein n=1 Tax=Rosellinia necatrix TaxID=77044 RepID=A0A1S8A917_ROSNE|nr:hypothetical protein SAMD00023353_3800970 [Rosellinia necatrix]